MNQQASLPTDEDRQILRESVRGFLGRTGLSVSTLARLSLFDPKIKKIGGIL